MSGANVKAIAALGELRTALLRFQSDANGSLDAMRNASIRTLAWLQSRLQYWQKELERRLQVLQKAQRELENCIRASQQASNRGERGYDCSELAAAVAIARRAVQEAQQELYTVRHFLKLVQEAYESFQREGQHLNQVMSQDLMHGANLLERSSASLSSYATSGGSGTGGSFGGGSDGIGGGSSTIAPGLSAVQVDDKGAFSILDWSGYPSSLPRPQGPFRLLPDYEYERARTLGDDGSDAFRKAHSLEAKGKQVHHIHPIKFGGDPTDPSNLILLTRKEHALYTTWWQRIQLQLQKSGGIL